MKNATLHFFRHDSTYKSMIAGVLRIGLSVFSIATFAQTTYPLACRGTTDGNAMHFLVMEASANALTASGAYGESVVTYFTMGQSAANPTTLPAGTCSWLDRGMSSSEPDALIQLFPGVQFQTVGYINMPNIQYSIDPTSAQLIPYVPNAMTTQMVDNPSANPVIGTLDDPGTFYTFNVFNNGHGFLQIVSIRCKGFCF